MTEINDYNRKMDSNSNVSRDHKKPLGALQKAVEDS